MYNCPICSNTSISGDCRYCTTCGWDLLDKGDQLQEALQQAKLIWTKKQELEKKNQELETENQELQSKIESLDKELREEKNKQLEKETEKPQLLLINSEIISKLDELIEAVKGLKQPSSEQSEDEEKSKDKTVEGSEKEEDSSSTNSTHTSSTHAKPSKLGEIENRQDSSKFHQKSEIARQDAARTPEEQKLAQIYNNKGQELIQHNIKVSLTQGSLEQDRLGNTTKLFSTNPRGTYWIISIILTQEKKYFLVPEYGFKVNTHNYQFLESYFACDGNHETGELKIVKPAIVKPLDREGEKWELVAQGVIKFTYEGVNSYD